MKDRQKSPIAQTLDFGGNIIAGFCVVHCLAMPIVVGLLPGMGMECVSHPSFHRWLAAVATVIGLLTFLPGMLCYGRVAAPLLGAAGLGLLCYAAFLGGDKCCCPKILSVPMVSDFVTPSGGLALILAHTLNCRSNSCKKGCCGSLR